MISRLKRAHISSRSAGRTVLLIASAAVAFASFASAVEVPLPRIEGQRMITAGRIMRILSSAGWHGGYRSQALAALESAYYREGHLFAAIRVEESEAETVLIIDEGEAARYGIARLHGAKAISEDEAGELLGVVSGLRFIPRELDAAIGQLLEQYDRLGYPFAQVWIDSIGIRPGIPQVDIVVFIVEGGKKRLSKVSVEGLTKTREDLVVELSGLETGKPYDGRMLNDAFLRLRSSGIFEEVSYPGVKLSAESEGVEVVLLVKEPQRHNSLSSALGYAKQEGTDDEVLSGMVRLNLLNIGGTLRDLNVFWTNDGAGKNETRIAYKDRFIAGQNLGVGATLEQVGLDTLYTWQSIGIQAERPMTRIGNSLLTVLGALHADRNVFSEGDLLRSWRARVTAGISLLRGDVERNMITFDGRFTWAEKKLWKRSTSSGQYLTQYILQGKNEIQIDFTQSIHMYNETAYNGLESNEDIVPLSEQFYIGGAATLRGYRENQFHGRRVAFSRWEIILGKARTDHAYLFTDGGYILNESKNELGGVDREDVFRAGYGFGLRTMSKLGKVDISFGVGEKLSLRQTKVHVILEQRF
ncbi:MAG: POTRA domain-containing protein [Candidatus Latescibacterota bacterium]